MISKEESKYTSAQLAYYRKEIRSAYQEGKLSSDQIEQLRSAGFSFDAIDKRKPVIDLTTGEVFETMASAAKSVDAKGRSTIAKAIEGKRLFKGHAFWRANEPNPPIVTEFREPKNTKGRPIIDLTTGKTFETMTAAAKSTGASGNATLRQAIEAKRLYKGHAFWWADDPNPPDAREFRALRSTTAKLQRNKT